MRVRSSNNIGAEGALVNTSANCLSVAICLRLMNRNASASRTKWVQRVWCLALAFGGLDAVPMAALESDATVTFGPSVAAAEAVCTTLG